MEVQTNTVCNGLQDFNKTKIREDMLADFSLAYQFSVMSFGVIIVLLNFLVVTTSGLIVKKKLEPRCTYLLLGNLSVIDMLIGFLAVVVVAFFKDQHYQSRLACCFQIGVFTSSLIVSVYTVVLIAVDRFLYIMHGIKYHQLVYPKRARIMITFTWIFGITIGGLPAFGWSNDWHQGELCRYNTFLPQSLIILNVTVGTAPIPVILITYIIILSKAFQTIGQMATETNTQARSSISDLESSSEKTTELRTFRGSVKVPTVSASISEASLVNRENSMSKISIRKNSKQEGVNVNKKKWKAFKIVLFTTGGYIVSWIPVFIESILVGLCDEEETPEKCLKLKQISKYLSGLTFLNCLLNPIIYAWWHNGFRKAAKKIFNRKKKCIMEWFHSVVPKR